MKKSKPKQCVCPECDGHPLGANFKLDPRAKEGMQIFWYETHDGKQLSKGDSRLDDDGVKKVSGEIINISNAPDPIGPVSSSPNGSYVLTKHLGGTIEINPEWFDSIYMGEIRLLNNEKQLRAANKDSVTSIFLN